MRLPDNCNCLPIVTLIAPLQVALVAGTHRIRVSSGGRLRACAGAASARTSAITRSPRAFIVGIKLPCGREVPVLRLPLCAYALGSSSPGAPAACGCGPLAEGPG